MTEMSQARVTDFYAQRRSSRRIGAQTQKRRKLSSSSDLVSKELAPCKRPKSDAQVRDLFQNIELNCKTNGIKFGPEVSFHEFTEALNSTGAPVQKTKGKTSERIPAAKTPSAAKPKPRRGRKLKKEPAKPESKPTSTLEQYLGKKLSQVSDTPSRADTKDDIAQKAQPQKAQPQKALEKTPTKRGHDEGKAPVRRKKAKDISEEDSGYSSQASVSDAQPAGREAAAAAKRCLGNQFRESTSTNGSTPSSVSSRGSGVEGQPLKQRTARRERQAPRGKVTENTVIPLSNKSPLKDRIKLALADNQKAREVARSGLENGKEAKKKLTPAEVRAKLAKCGKLEELQAVLGKVKRSTAVRKEAVPKPPEEKQPQAIPAYKKYRHLAVAAPPSLLLPGKYRTLEEMFQSMDTVVSMLHNRTEGCPFSKLKAGVQELCRKSFQLSNLGQIKTVYPSSYTLYHQKCSRPISQRGRVKEGTGGYELLVEPNLEDTDSGSTIQPTTTSSSSTMKDIHSQKSFLKKFTPSILIARRTLFHSNLVDIVKERHREFLQKQSPPLSVPDDKITRWHPKFPLEQVSDIEAAPLPQPPHVQTYSTAKDVLDKARDLMNPKVVKALELIAQKSEETASKAEKKSTAAKDAGTAKMAKSSSEPAPGISSDLLERIRAKEARHTQAAMMRSQVDENKIGMLERLPELCMIVRGLFLAEKKAALTVDMVIKKVGDSCKASLSQVELEKHVDLMLEILPDWIKSLKIRKETYLKIDKKKELKELTNQITTALKAEKRK